MNRHHTQSIIAIDYDDTFTADPEAWSLVIATLQRRGHKVVCISARFEEPGNRSEIMTAMPQGVDVLLCYGWPKRAFAKANGVDVDIWIDDLPEAIPSHADMILMTQGQTQ